MRSYLAVMANLHQVINLCSSANKGFAHYSPVNTCVSSDFNIVLKYGNSDLGYFIVSFF